MAGCKDFLLPYGAMGFSYSNKIAFYFSVCRGCQLRRRLLVNYKGSLFGCGVGEKLHIAG
mgnify:CR=1 FL=1